MKIKKQVDYSKVPQPIWDKEWAEFIESMDSIDVSLKALSNCINNLERVL